jgi:hypothetical protein
MAFSRNPNKPEQESEQIALQPEQSQPEQVTRTASLEDYNNHDGRDYAARTNAVLLNWGEPMTAHDLERAGLKANRVPIPGDWDYHGVVMKEAM